MSATTRPCMRFLILLAKSTIFLAVLSSCAAIEETARDDEIPGLAKTAKAAGLVPKPKWEQTVNAENVNYIEYLDSSHVLVGEDVLLQGDTLWGMEVAVPVPSAISLYNVQTGQRDWTSQLKRPSGVNVGLLRYQIIATKPQIILLANDLTNAALVGLDQSNGKQLWRHEFEIPVVTAFSTSGQALFVAKIVNDKDIELNRYNVLTGKPLWQRKIEKVAGGESSVKLRSMNDVLYVFGNRIQAINGKTGADIWVKELGFSKQQILDVIEWGDNFLVYSPNQARAVSLADGKEIWRYSDSKYQIQNILVQPKAIFVSEKLADKNNNDARILALDPATGQSNWQHRVKGEVRSPLIMANDALFYTTACCINKLDRRSGKLISNTDVPGYFDEKYDIVLPDMITIYNDTVVVSRETYGVVGVSSENDKIKFNQPVPVSLTYRYFTSHFYSNLLDRLSYFSKKLKDERILQQQTFVQKSTQSMLVPFRVNSQRLTDIASVNQFELEQARREYNTATDPSRRGLAKEKMTQISQGRTAALGAEAASMRVAHAGESMMATINFLNAVTGAYFSVIEAMHKARYKASVVKLQEEIDHALSNHARCFQHGYYVRPFMGNNYAGVTLVDLDTGKRTDVRHSVYSYDIDEYGLKVPSVAVHPQKKEIFVEGISLNPNSYVHVDIGKHRIPYTSVRRFDLQSLQFEKNFPNPDLIKAAGEGRIDIVRELLSADSGIVTLKKYGGSALLKAAGSNQVAIASELIAKGADVNAFKGEGPIIAAVKNKDLPMAKLLVKHGADINAKKKFKDAPLDIAAENGDIDMMRFLIKSGAKLNTGSFGGGPLTSAANNGKVEMVRLLLELGVDVNEKSYWGTPLARAASKGYLEIVQLLIKAGANVNIPADARHPLSAAKDSLSLCSTPCDKPYDKIIELLVEAGAKEPMAIKK